MRISHHPDLASLRADLAALAAPDDPFLDPAFLDAAERHGAATPATGWQPCHVVVRDTAGTCRGFMPLYARTDSYGDFAWDFGWAAAWRQAGLAYYPKLVTGIPCTPSPGPRCLLHPAAEPAAVIPALIEGALALARAQDLSVWQCLFVQADDLPFVEAAGLLIRDGVQYHWRNDGYRDFDDFLAALSSKRRKEIRRERRRVAESGVELATLHGDEIPDELWPAIHRHYRSTFLRLGGYPSFSEDFFREVGRTLGRRMVVFVACAAGRPVASSICYRNGRALFGRHWGTDAAIDCLHFELCYYQGIDYCLRHGLHSFEPGAGGEHKVARGFLPTVTRCGYWVGDARMRRVVADFIARERQTVGDYAREVIGNGPYADRDLPQLR
jgi:predicted N-acyltransferase